MRLRASSRVWNRPRTRTMGSQLPAATAQSAAVPSAGRGCLPAVECFAGPPRPGTLQATSSSTTLARRPHTLRACRRAPSTWPMSWPGQRVRCDAILVRTLTGTGSEPAPQSRSSPVRRSPRDCPCWRGPVWVCCRPLRPIAPGRRSSPAALRSRGGPRYVLSTATRYRGCRSCNTATSSRPETTGSCTPSWCQSPGFQFQQIG